MNTNPRKKVILRKFTETEPCSFILDYLHTLSLKQIIQAYFMLVPYCLI